MLPLDAALGVLAAGAHIVFAIVAVVADTARTPHSRDDKVTGLKTLVEFPRQSARDVLTEVLRTGARQLLATAIEAEVDEYVAARAKTVDAAGRRGVVRNGHLPKRALQTPLGDVTVQQPRVRDRRPDDERETFRSAILPPYLRKTPSLEALYPWLYLKGLPGDFGGRCRRC